jgi:WD40 repeat protein
LRLLLTIAGRAARLRDLKTGAPVLTLVGHPQDVTAAAFSPDGTRIVTAASDKTARVWDAGTGRQLFVIEQPEHFLSAVFSPDGKQIATSAIKRSSGVSARSPSILPHLERAARGPIVRLGRRIEGLRFGHVERYSEPLFHLALQSKLGRHTLKLAVPSSDFRIASRTDRRSVLQAGRPIMTKRSILGAAALGALKERHWRALLLPAPRGGNAMVLLTRLETLHCINRAEVSSIR